MEEKILSTPKMAFYGVTYETFSKLVTDWRLGHACTNFNTFIKVKITAIAKILILGIALQMQYAFAMGEVPNISSRNRNYSAGAIIYVATNGSDANPGTLNSPKLTIQNAINSANPGDTIIVKNGTYKETIDLKGKISFLTSMYFFTNDTNDIKNTIINGDNNGNNNLITSDGAIAHHIYGLTIENVRLRVIELTSNSKTFKLSRSIIRNSGSYGQWGVIGVGGNGILDSCIIYNLKGRYIISAGSYNSPSAVITNNTIYGCSSNSQYEDYSVIHVEGTQKARVINNLIFRNNTSGIDFGGNGQDSMIFVNNTVVLNDGYGIRFKTWGGTYTGIVVNNISKYNKLADVSGNTNLNGPAVYVKNNFFGENGLMGSTNLISSNNTLLDTSGNIGGNPYFVDTTNNDFRLKPYSQAIGKGTTSNYLLNTDITGGPRIQSARTFPDMGAFESQYRHPSPLLSYTDNTNNSVKLYWFQTSFSKLATYKIYRSTSSISENAATGIIVDTIKIQSTSYTDSSGIISGTRYYYRMKSVDSSGNESGMSNEISAVPDNIKLPNSISIDNSPSIARISWDTTGMNGLKYRIYRSTDSTVKTLLRDTISSNSFTDSSFSRNTTYYYWLKSINNNSSTSDYCKILQLIPTNIWVISAEGNDQSSGTKKYPKNTINSVISKIVDNDTILIQPGKYTEKINIQKNINIIGDGNIDSINSPDKIILFDFKNESNGFTLKKAFVKNITLSNSYIGILATDSLIVDSCLFTNIKSQAIYQNQGAGDMKIKNSTFRFCGEGLFTFFKNPTIINCIFHNNITGLNLYNSNYNIVGSLFYSNSTALSIRIDLNGGGKKGEIQYTTITNNSRPIYNDDGVLYISNSIIWDNLSLIHSQGQNSELYLKNLILEKGLKGIDTGQFTNRIKSVKNLYESNPYYNNIKSKDFSISNYSPAIGIGDSIILNYTQYDLNRNKRPSPNGSSSDIGAYENENALPSTYISLEEASDKKIKLSWSMPPSLSNAIYRIFRSTSSITDTSGKFIVALTNANGYSDSLGLTNKTRYYYKIIIEKGGFKSALSNEVAATPDNLSLPNTIKLENNPTSAKLSWDTSGMNGLKFRIYRSADSTNKILVKDSLLSNTFTDTSFIKNKINYYWIKTTNGEGSLSDYSKTLVLIPTNLWYVDSAKGNDNSGLGTEQSPFKTIGKAVSSVKVNDTIFVKPGTYQERVSITNKSISLISTDGPEKTKIVQEQLESVAINVSNEFFSDPYMTLNIKGFSIYGNGKNSGNGFRIDRKSYADIFNCYIEGFEVALSTYYGYYSIQNSIINNNRIFIYNDVGDADKTPIVNNCTVTNIRFAYTLSNPVVINKIYNTIFSNKKNTPLENNPFEGPKVLLSNVILDTAIKSYNPQTGSSVFYTNNANELGFVSFDNNDFRLANNSSAIGLGNSIITNKFDYSGNKRPNPSGSSPDIGAFENPYGLPNSNLTLVEAGNKKIKFSWSKPSTVETPNYRIYRSTSSFSDTTGKFVAAVNNINTYQDSLGLDDKTKYYYSIVVEKNGITSGLSNEISATAVRINLAPTAVKLIDKEIKTVGEYNFVKLTYSAAGSKDVDGKVSKFEWYVNDNLVNNTDSTLTYYFKLGTNTLKLVVVDNEGAKDSSQAIVKLVSFYKQFKGGIMGGASALNQNIIYTADTAFDQIKGHLITILDRNANTFFEISVPFKVFTTPSVAPDTSVFITNGSNLNGFNSKGVALWSAVPLAGLSYVTPTIDSLLSRIYLGVSNKNFLAYDYRTGKNIWSYQCDAPINSSAVITPDRKLIFTSEVGTLYGFDISKVEAPTAPKWKISFGDLVVKSPAVDAAGSVYAGTDGGRFIKFVLNADGSTTLKWNITLSGAIKSSPVIDADGYVYVGNEKGDFYKINPTTGSIIWTYNVGAAIRSTPSISDYGMIYIATMKGMLYALSTNKELRWKYQDVGPISANILHVNGMVYLPSETGSYTAIFDNPNSININIGYAANTIPFKSSLASSDALTQTNKFLDYLNRQYVKNTFYFADTIIPARKPVWGTFQGDYRRSGSLSTTCPGSIIIERNAAGNLVSSVPTNIQWYKNNTLITGADSASIKPTESGYYTVKSSLSACQSVSSANYYYVTTAVTNLSQNDLVRISPNPFNTSATIIFKQNGYNKVHIDIIDISTGKIVKHIKDVYSNNQLYLNELKNGVYNFKIYTSDGKIISNQKMMKF